MDPKPLAYLQLTSLEAFIAELKRRGIGEARLSEWSRRLGLFEECKLHLTALDEASRLILRYDHIFYNGLAILHEDECEKYEGAKRKAEGQIADALEKAGIKLLDGEYHNGKAEW